MKPFRQSAVEYPEIHTEGITRRIVDSVERLGIDKRRRLIIVGSAALVLYGAQLPEYDEFLGRGKPRPGDVDIRVDASTFLAILQEGTTPGGLPVTFTATGNPYINILRIDSDSPEFLPVDIITGYSNDGWKSPEHYDRKFRKHHSSRTVALRPDEPDGILIATPCALREHLVEQSRLCRDPKYQADLRAFDERPQNKARDYSVLKASIGSSLAAFRAGK